MYELISVIYTEGSHIKTASTPSEIKRLTYDNKYSLDSILKYADTYEYTSYVGDNSIMLLNFKMFNIKLRIYSKIEE